MKKVNWAYVAVRYGVSLGGAVVLCAVGFLANLPALVFLSFFLFAGSLIFVPHMMKKSMEKYALELEKTFSQQGFAYNQKFTSNSGIFYIDLSGRLAVVWKLNPKELYFANLANVTNIRTNDGKQLRGTSLVSCQFHLDGKKYKIYTLRVSNGQLAMNAPQVLEAISKADQLCEMLNTAKQNALAAARSEQMVYRIIGNLLRKLIDNMAGKLPKCESCKETMQKDGSPLLCVIPVFHDHEYTPSPSYYEKNCIPIRDTGDIPTGQRACRFWTLTCPECGQHKIMVEDFLQVRGSELVEKRELYSLQEIDLMAISKR